MKFDRGFIKWQPFESVVSSKQIVNTLLKEKSKISKPIISDEEKALIEQQIIDAYFTTSKVQINYFINGTIKNITSKIKKIDQVYKMIYLDNNIKLLFNQIVSIETK